MCTFSPPHQSLRTGEKKPTKSGIYVPKFGIVSAPSASEASFFDSFDPLSLSNSLGSSDGVGGSGLGVSGLGASGLGGGKYTETVMEKKKREKEREKRRALFVALFFGLAGMVHKKDGDYEAAKVLHHAGFFHILFFFLFSFFSFLNKQKKLLKRQNQLMVFVLPLCAPFCMIMEMFCEKLANMMKLPLFINKLLTFVRVR